MKLAAYKKKRSFSKTPEPTGGKADSDALRFVVQKHAASHLHYDFRLEMKSVLKSWAVPKGPSTDPSVKRLAMMVEDHPYDYRNFEGIIPKGQYGGGTVIVWDEGTYIPADGTHESKAEMEKDLLHQLHKGKISLILKGKKLKGEYTLVKSSYQGENSWLLIKAKDKYAKTTDITKKDRSVISGKTISQVEKTSTTIYGQDAGREKSNGQELDNKPARTVKKKTTNISKTKVQTPAPKKAKFPTNLVPMLATLVDKPFDDEGWLYEIKWDGYRAVAYLNKGKVELKSRNNKSFNEKFYPIYAALSKVKLNAVIDGEIIVAGENGVSSFGDLQNWRSEADGDLKFYVFDLLWLDGFSYMHLPLTERRKKLESILPSHPLIHISQAFPTSGIEFFEAAGKMKLEGIMAKKADSDYKPGVRSKEWLKIKTGNRQEVVIGGFTKNEGTGKSFSALLVGVYENGKLQYTGKIGTGFSDKLQKEMMQLFKPLITPKNPFETEPDINKPSRFRPNPPKAQATWLKPKLVCEVSFTEMTSDGVMRHPSFEGMRVDKNAKDIILEKSKPAARLVKKSILHEKKMISATTGKKERKTLVNPTDETQERTVGGHNLKFTNLQQALLAKGKE